MGFFAGVRLAQWLQQEWGQQIPFGQAPLLLEEPLSCQQKSSQGFEWNPSIQLYGRSIVVVFDVIVNVLFSMFVRKIMVSRQGRQILSLTS